MAKYIVIEDFEAQWLRPPLTTPQIAVFKKDSVIQALPYPGGTLKTRVDGTQPSGKAGEILVDVVESKVKMLPDDDAEKLKKDEQKKKIVQYAIYGAGALFLWWFIYGKNRKKTKTLSGVKKIGSKGDIYEYIIPTYALPYLVNNDPSGLTDEEIKKIDKFADEVYKETGTQIEMGIDYEQEPYFKWRNDIDGNLGNSVIDVKIRSKK